MANTVLVVRFARDYNGKTGTRQAL